jgi:hypothetical protein
MPLLFGNTAASGAGLDGLTSLTAAPSATYLYTAGVRTDGTYWLNPSGTSPFQAYCIMSRDGGGWVKVLQYWNGTDIGGSSAVNANGTWTTGEINYQAGKLATSDITALHQTKTTALLRTNPKAHRYWKYQIESGATHFPRASRIGIRDKDAVETNMVVFTSDNCGDSGGIPTTGEYYTVDLGSPKVITNSYFYSVYGSGTRTGAHSLWWSDNNSTWYQAVPSVATSNNGSCGMKYTDYTTGFRDALFNYGVNTAKLVQTGNLTDWGTDQDPTASYTFSMDTGGNANYSQSRTYTNDTRGRCTHGNGNFKWHSDHNYTSDAICHGFYDTYFGSNLHWMGAPGYANGEQYFGAVNQGTSFAVYVK